VFAITQGETAKYRRLAAAQTDLRFKSYLYVSQDWRERFYSLAQNGGKWLRPVPGWARANKVGHDGGAGARATSPVRMLVSLSH